MSAGRAAMWIISFGIAAAVVVVLALSGLDGVPGEWIGLVVAAALAGVAFVLGYLD